MNKKGFTLIEMLVVIAIIAVLVSIIVPVVSNATTKAKAATDAANLRSVAASAAIDWLADGDFDKTSYDVTCKTNSDWDLTFSVVDEQVVAKFGDYGVEYFANIAENGGETTPAG